MCAAEAAGEDRSVLAAVARPPPLLDLATVVYSFVANAAVSAVTPLGGGRGFGVVDRLDDGEPFCVVLWRTPESYV